MKIALATALLLTGCGPAINAELSLVEQSKRGLAAVDQSLKDREAIAQQQFDDRRAKLDAAFDADTVAHMNELSTEWVTAARKAYGDALDALAAAKSQSQQASQIDRDNLAAADKALDEITTLNRAQLNWALFKESK